MKYPALMVALLSLGCVATRQAQEALEQELIEVRAATADLKTATLAGATQEELDALDARLALEVEEATEAAKAVPEAVKEDLANIKEGTAGVLGLGVAPEAGILALLMTGASWMLRDRRKRKGTDPLQDKNVTTPPTT